MLRIVIVILSLFMFTFQAYSVENPNELSKNWAQWRGPEANGVAPNSNPPIEWSEEKNIRWKIEIPGKGHATPIIWDDKIFIKPQFQQKKTQLLMRKTKILSLPTNNEGCQASRQQKFINSLSSPSIAKTERQSGKKQ